MKRTLLELTQSILNDMDSENVNSIDDSDEAAQIASVIRDTYFNLIAARKIPEHNRLIKLTALSDSSRPTYFLYPEHVKEIRRFDYNGREVHWKEPEDFLDDMPSFGDDNAVAMSDPTSGITIYCRDDKDPQFYTSFDDKYIVCNSYDSLVDTTLQNSKSRCLGTQYPTFSLTDDFIPELDETLFPYLLAEAKSVCFSIFKSGSDPKIEQSARRLKAFVQNDQHRTKLSPSRPQYGRNR
jgi:hypothetical protein